MQRIKNIQDALEAEKVVGSALLGSKTYYKTIIKLVCRETTDKCN